MKTSGLWQILICLVTRTFRFEEPEINRLVGAGEGHSISGINYQIQSQGESLIQVLSGTMENLTWKNITITSADATKVSGGTNIGLISINQGEILEQCV